MKFHLISSILFATVQIIYGQYQQYGQQQHQQPTHQSSYLPQGIQYSTSIPSHGVYQPQQQQAGLSSLAGYQSAGHQGAGGYQTPHTTVQYFPSSLSQPQSYNHAGSYNPSAGAAAAAQPSYSHGGGFPSSGASAGHAAAGGQQPNISPGEALMLHAKALEAHNNLVAQHIKDLGLPSPSDQPQGQPQGQPGAQYGAPQQYGGQGQYSPQAYAQHNPQSYSHAQPSSYSPQAHSAGQAYSQYSPTPQYTSRHYGGGGGAAQYGPSSAYRGG